MGIYCICIHLHNTTNHLRMTVKLIITCYIQVDTCNDRPIDLNQHCIRGLSGKYANTVSSDAKPSNSMKLLLFVLLEKKEEI